MHPHGPVHELHSIRIAHLQDPVQLSHVQGSRLLKQHVLLLLRGLHRPPHVQARWERHVHGVHLRVVEDGLVAAVDLHGFGEAVLGREPLGLLDRAAAHGGEGGVGGEGDGSRHLLCYLGAS
eukprot:TRINITY_DN3140_c0_g1_i4.p2 TRINITY_DN3140_c0_g1~~TRINITY_DN3140_c0_g1_i4.p2  ORF type:complete len:122 (+),score=4.33 TRINITY_DN3140_c0_g1_i4:230-595(+)